MKKTSILIFVILAMWSLSYADFAGTGFNSPSSSTTLTTGSVTSAHIADNEIGPQDIKAAGTPDNTMYPRYKSATEFEWVTPAGSGDVVGPGSATADALVLFNGTGGKTIKDSTYMITAAGAALLDDAAAENQRTTLGLDNVSNYPTRLRQRISFSIFSAIAGDKVYPQLFDSSVTIDNVTGSASVDNVVGYLAYCSPDLASCTKVNNSDWTFTSTPSSVTSFDNAVVPSGYILKWETTSVGTTSSNLFSIWIKFD